MQDWELAYAAGAVDGEGCVSANRSTNQPRQKNPCYRIQVRVTNTNPRMITFMYDRFGGNIQIRETALLLSMENREEIKASLCNKLSLLKKATIRIDEVA